MRNWHRVYTLVVFTVLVTGSPAAGTDEYSFDLDEFEKKSFSWGGYGELKWEHARINPNSSLSLLDSRGDADSTQDRLTGTLQLDGNYDKDMFSFNWIVQAYGQQDQDEWADDADVFVAYGSIKPTPSLSLDLGKKAFKWGKGYAWNPVGVINRTKDPNNPEEALEGYYAAELDLIKSFSGTLQTAALTTVAVPVWEDVNEDFGERDNVNLATKLYLLYRDIDIDFILFTGESRSTRYGFDFSTNLTTNFEIHGEVAYVPEQSQKFLNDDGNIEIREIVDTSYLLGLRYLSESDITTILEYYHNGDGYTEQEQDRFHQLIENADNLYTATGDASLYDKAVSVNQGGYGRPQSGRNYLYTRVTQKEPFGLLYFTPGITAIINLDDESYSLSPEAIYTGFTNWELRFRLSLLGGSSFTEYGEKQNENKLELRIRYFF